MFLLAFVATTVPHLFLSKVHAKQILTKWKPQLVAGTILSVSGVKPYTNAVIATEKLCTGALVRYDSAPCFFVVTCDESATIITASILSTSLSAAEIMHDLETWHEDKFPDAVLIDGQLDDPSSF